MPFYAAFLRGVNPMNLSMPALQKAIEGAGCTEVKTLLSSGNVVFRTRKASANVLERKVEIAIQKATGSRFSAFVRSAEELERLLDSAPYAPFRLAPQSKRIVTFLHRLPEVQPELPMERDGSRIFCTHGLEIFSAYVPRLAKGPVLMAMIERTWGKDVTTRTWDTVEKVARATAR